MPIINVLLADLLFSRPVYVWPRTIVVTFGKRALFQPSSQPGHIFLRSTPPLEKKMPPSMDEHE